MERLLRLALRQFIHAGNLENMTRAERCFTFGDGSGPPVAIRFTTHAAPVWRPVRSGAEVRRSLYGRPHGRRGGNDRRRAR